MGSASPPPPPARFFLLLLVFLCWPAAGASETPPARPRLLRPFTEVDRQVQRFHPSPSGSSSHYGVFQVDPSSHRLYVGARDSLFALTLGSIGQPAKEISWMAPKAHRDSCMQKGKGESECRNFIRVLEFANRSHLFVCGTFAFDPRCGYVKVSDFRAVEQVETGRRKCPFEPLQPSSALMADGALYVATVSNFLGSEPIITRATGNHEEALRTENSAAWLYDPEFVASAFLRESESGEDSDKVYFFFTETAREYDFYEKVRVARVARVCKGDMGGQKTLQKRWTTFLKAQLVCSDPETGAVFSVLRDAVLLPSIHWNATVFYGVFVAQGKGESGSAICAYSVQEIRRAMKGRFKEFRRECDKWTSVMPDDVPDPRPGECVTGRGKAGGVSGSLTLPDRVLTFVRDHPLMDDLVYPLGGGPLLVVPGTRYLRLAVHRVKALSGEEHPVLYLGTEDGHLQKAIKIGLRLFLLEDLTLFAEPQPVRSLKLYQNWLYVGSDTEVTQVNTSTCGTYKTCRDCLLSRDPTCAWSQQQGACQDHRAQAWTSHLIQDITSIQVAVLCPLESTEPPVLVEVPAQLSTRVVLPCSPPSTWSRCQWQRPSQDLSAYVLHSHSIEFTVAAATLGHYICRCTEAGVGIVMAAFSLVEAGGQGVLGTSRSVERNYSVLVGVLCFVLGIVGSSSFLLLRERHRRERHQRELLCRQRNGLDLMASTATSCSHEPQTPSSPEDERHPLATAKKNGTPHGYPHHLYINELESAEQACIYLAGVPLATCDETSI